MKFLLSLKKNFIPLIGGITIMSMGGLTSLLVKTQDQWYEHLLKPSFNPPDQIFGPVWSILYMLLGFVLGDLFKNRYQQKKELFLFVLQLSLNFLWVPLFFRYHRIDLAFIDLTILWGNLIFFLYLVRANRCYLLLLLPYLLWITFALILNFNLYVLNKSDYLLKVVLHTLF